AVRSALRGDDEVAASGAGDARMRAVAGETLEAAPFCADPGGGGALAEDFLDLLRALFVDLGRSLDELGIGEADGRGVGDGQRLGMKPDEMGVEAGGERA